MQRQKIRGADLKANPMQYSGIINAEKCIVYLRGIGVEIDDDTADAWLDTQGVHRFFQSEKAPFLRVERWHCKCGEMEGFRKLVRGRVRRSKKKQDDNEEQGPAICESCKSGWWSMSLYFTVLRDGTIQDRRPANDRYSPIIVSEWMP